MRLQPSAADGAIDKSQRERESWRERERDNSTSNRRSDFSRIQIIPTGGQGGFEMYKSDSMIKIHFRYSRIPPLQCPIHWDFHSSLQRP